MIIDINSDIGEGMDSQESLLPFLTSVNIACGGHAGDESTMKLSVEQATRHGLKIGAHPGYPDKANFGRLELNMPLSEVEQFVYQQICALAAFTTIVHVKPHGALYNQAVNNVSLARAIARGTARFSRKVTLVGLAGSLMLSVFAEEGFDVSAEAFADRRYEAEGSLRSRKFADALITDPQEAAAQAQKLAGSGLPQTICIHSDTPGAALIAAAVAKALR